MREMVQHRGAITRGPAMARALVAPPPALCPFRGAPRLHQPVLLTVVTRLGPKSPFRGARLPALLLISRASIIINLGQIGVYLYRLAIIGNGPVEITFVLINDAPVTIGLSIVWINCYCFIIVNKGSIKVTFVLMGT